MGRVSCPDEWVSLLAIHSRHKCSEPFWIDQKVIFSKVMIKPRYWQTGVRLFASPFRPPVNQLPRYINNLWRCERFCRWGETGEKINVLAFYTSWMEFKASFACADALSHLGFLATRNMTRINVGLARSYVKLLLSSWKTYMCNWMAWYISK